MKKILILILLSSASIISNGQTQFVSGLSWKYGDSTLVGPIEYYAKKDIAVANATPKENQYWTVTRIIYATTPVIEYVLKSKYDSLATDYTIYKTTTQKQIDELNRVIDSITKPPTEPEPPYSGLTEKKLVFSFTLDNSASVSAGVYKGEKLVRTLFSNKDYLAGSFKEQFNPLTDNLDTINDVLGMTVKYIVNNLTDEWEGVIGNTSNYYTGDSVHKSYEHIQGMAFSGDNGFFARGYTEGNESNGRFKISDPNTYLRIFPNYFTSMNPKFVVTDNVNVYFGGIDNYASHAGFVQSDFVYGISAKDYSETTFSGGTVYKSGIGRTYKSAIDMVHSLSGAITGMAIQKNGPFLFVSHKLLNELHVLDKSGAIVRVLNIPDVSNLCIDNNDNIWVQTLSILTKYEVDSAANLTSLLTIDGFKAPLGMAVSPTTNALTVIDGGSSQQIKAFHNDFGYPFWTFGQEGGYANGATVTNDKFYFSDSTKSDFKSLRAYIAYQPDGSFWVGDICNSRSQHYTAERVFIDRIMFLRRSYSMSVDQTDSSRLFSDYLEFKIDYSKPLKPNNGSWELVRNWAYGFSDATENKQARLDQVVTLNNGKTYALWHQNGIKSFVELQPNGFIRFCKTSPSFNTGREALYPDGSIRNAPTNQRTARITWGRRELIGFNENSDPQYGPTKVTVSAPFTGIEPWAGNANNTGEVTKSGKLISFLGTVPNNYLPNAEFTKHFHLGAINIKDSSWDWLTAHATTYDYRGPYPNDGAFDIGNGVVYAAWWHKVVDSFIFHQYNGEFYKGAQTNYWTIFSDNGLMIHRLGVRRNQSIPQIAAQYGMAGNAFKGSITKYNDSYYIYHNDESVHSGIHRWRVGGISTVKSQSASLDLAAVPIDTNTVDLMGDIPRDAPLLNGAGGWVRSPAGDSLIVLGSKWWQIRTSAMWYDRFSKPDIYLRYRMPIGGNICTLSKDLGDNNLATWSLSGDFNFNEQGDSFDQKNFTETGTGGQFTEILDNNNKIILRFGWRFNTTTQMISLVANNVTVYSAPNFDAKQYREFWRKVSFEVLHDDVLFSFGDYKAFVPIYDLSANKSAPKTFRIYNWTNTQSMDRIISFKDLKLIK